MMKDFHNTEAHDTRAMKNLDGKLYGNKDLPEISDSRFAALMTHHRGSYQIRTFIILLIFCHIFIIRDVLVF